MSDLQIFNTSAKDYEYIGLRFNDRHCGEFGLSVVFPSGLKQDSLFGEFEDKILEVSGKDGAYYFGTRMKPKRFTISFAFDDMTSTNKKDIIAWLNPKTVGQIVFDESPYKYHYVKVAAQPIFSFIPFEEAITNGMQHIFKGTIDVDFIATDPYGYSDYSLITQIPIWNGNPTTWTTNKPYSSTNLPGWLGESGIHTTMPTPALAEANVSTGYSSTSQIPAGNITPNFYNGGNIEVPMAFTVILPVFNTGSQWEFKNITQDPDEIFELESLKYITALASTTGYWKIVCDPSKGLITGSSSSLDSYATTYNLGALHNGTWLKAYPGNNFLYTSHIIYGDVQAFTLSYKYKYL